MSKIREALERVRNGDSPEEIVAELCEAGVLDERKVFGKEWRPKDQSTAWEILRLLADSAGLKHKDLSKQLGKTPQSTWRGLIGLQDSGMVANIKGRGYVLTKVGAAWARQQGIQVTGKVSAEIQATAGEVAATRALPTQIQMNDLMKSALGNLASDSGLGQKTRGTKLDEIGFASRTLGDKMEWTVTLKGNSLGAQYEIMDAFIRNRKGSLRILKNSSSVLQAAQTQVASALRVSNINDAGSFTMAGYQADATSTGGDDVVVTFQSSPFKLPEKEKVAKMPTQAELLKRAQRLLGRAASPGRRGRGAPRMGSVARAMGIIQKMQQPQ